MDLASSAGDHPNNLVIPIAVSQNNSPLPASLPAASHVQLGSSSAAALTNSPDKKPKKSSLTCTTCRARKVRCNGARDICSNCERLGFPCSYDDADPGALSGALPRRRVRQACLSCHSRKARCSGHMPSCDRCRAQGIECVYRPSKRTRIAMRNDGRSPQSHDGDKDDGHIDSDPGLTDPASTHTPGAYIHDPPCPDESFDALIGRTFEKFFRHVHHIPMYSFLHRASLMERYHSGKVDRALLLALVGITSYLTDMGPGMREYGEKCTNDAEGLIFSDYSRPSTIKIQALMLIIKHRVLSKKFSSAFMLLGIASRFATALRLNHECPNLCFLAQESRRRLMWALYCVDAGISGGYRDFSLWNAERIYVSLPCNERNFEFDLPQPTERLVHDPEAQHPQQQVEDIGSLALHIRIQHIRRRIMEFTKRAVLGRNIKPEEIQSSIWNLHKDLDDFAAHLPTSFQFSESSLRLRAYSPRICAFIMIHVWWRQCHCDLYRLALVGLRESLPRAVIETFDEGFIDHCQRQCVEHSMEMANIFSLMQKLNAKPVTDLDLAVCAYQCARMLTFAVHNFSRNFDLTHDTVLERSRVCLQTVKECCVGATAEGIKADLERLITHGISTRTTPSSPDPTRNNRMAIDNGFSRHSLLKNMTVTDDHEMNDASQFVPNTTALGSSSVVAMTDSTFPPSLVADPWVPESQITPDIGQPMSDVHASAAEKMGENISDMVPRQEFGASEINNAYDGGLDGLGLDNGIDYGLTMEPNLWMPNNDWLSVESLNGGIGV